jgi:hypothetical protein
MRHLAPLVLLAWPALASAQSVTIPRHFAQEEGLLSVPYPLSVTSRTQQIVNDLVGPPRILTRLALRRDAIDGVGWAPAPIPVRSVQLELSAGHAVAVASASTTFAANYIGAPVKVFSGQISTPTTWQAAVRQAPAPFDLPIVFTAPFAYNGRDNLLFDFEATTSATGSVGLDAGDASQPLFSRGSLEMHGVGCTTQSGVLELRANVQTQSFPLSRVNYNWPLRGAPAMAPALMLVGAQRQSIPVPGLCQPLRIVPLLSFAGAADASGQWAPSIGVPMSTSLFSIVVEVQAAALDPSQTLPIKLAVSNGLACRAAPIAVSPAFEAVILFAAAPNATVATSRLTGRCLVMNL